VYNIQVLHKEEDLEVEA